MWQISPFDERRLLTRRHSYSAFRGCQVPLQSRHVIEEAVAQVFSVRKSDFTLTTRGRAGVAEARQVAMYLAHVALGITMRDVGGLFARDRTTVAHACGVIEDKRDEPAFDRALELLEWTIIALLLPRRFDAAAIL